MSPTSTFKIKIGSFEQEYQLWQTHAPRSYDSAGTITIKETTLKPRDGQVPSYSLYERYVLIPVDQVAWHEGRYASGLYGFEVEEIDRLMENWIADKLLGRLKGVA